MRLREENTLLKGSAEVVLLLRWWCQEVSIFVVVAVPGETTPRGVQHVDPFILSTCILPTAEAFYVGESLYLVAS